MVSFFLGGGVSVNLITSRKRPRKFNHVIFTDGLGRLVTRKFWYIKKGNLSRPLAKTVASFIDSFMWQPEWEGTKNLEKKKIEVFFFLFHLYIQTMCSLTDCLFDGTMDFEPFN